MKYKIYSPIKTIPINWIPDQHDTDFDGVPNYRDCNPWNPWQQDKVPYVYLIAKIKGKWQNLGAYSLNNIERVISDAKKIPGVQKVLTTKNRNEAENRNRLKMLGQLERGVEIMGSPLGKVLESKEKKIKRKLSKEEFLQKTYAEKQR